MKRFLSIFAIFIVITAFTSSVYGGASQTFKGDITGNAATVTTNANLTGPITSVGNATSIASQTGTGTKFVMDASPTLTGTTTIDAFRSLSGATASTPTATPVTLFTSSNYSAYIVFVYLLGGNTSFMATAMVINDGTGAGLYNYEHGDYITITLSGANVQATQSSGGDTAIQYKVLKIY